MNTYIISYDLVAPGRDYSRLIAAIKQAAVWCSPLESFWIVKTEMPASQIRAVLATHMDSNDRLLVIEAGKEAAWQNLPDAVSNWLKSNL